jgi:hypothetical protein
MGQVAHLFGCRGGFPHVDLSGSAISRLGQLIPQSTCLGHPPRQNQELFVTKIEGRISSLTARLTTNSSEDRSACYNNSLRFSDGDRQ